MPTRVLTPPEGAVLPEPAGAVVGEPQQVVAAYVDTAALDLLRHGVALSRRQGGDDEGWWVELPPDVGAVAGAGGPGGSGGEVVRVPLSGSLLRPPRPVRDLLLGLVLDEPLVEVVRLDVSRVEAERAGGAVGDDQVRAEVVLPGVTPAPAARWRVWRARAEEPEQLDDLVVPLLAAGATRAETGAELLARVLGDAAPADPVRVRKARPSRPAARVLHHYLRQQHHELLAADLAVRRREPDGVHDLRVALRRLRTVLATFRPLVERPVTEPLRAQMREVSHLLGDARDAEVVTTRLTHLLDDEPADLRLGAARRTIGDDGRSALRVARRGVEATLRSPEYVALLRALRDLVADPPWSPVAEEPARQVVPHLLGRDLRRLRRRVGAAQQADGTAERARLLHEARKAAKRLRYACEAGAVVVGSDAGRLRVATQELQDVLGEHHDTMSTRSVLRRLAGRADLHPGTTFTLGRLHAREEQAARRLEDDARTTWAALDRPKVTGFL